MNNLHRKHAVSILLTVVGAGLALLGSTASEVCMWIGFGLMFISVIINLTIRCPACGRNLVTKRWTVPNFCPECGHAIDGSNFEE